MLHLIYLLRRNAGLTQAELAEAVGLSQADVCELEHGVIHCDLQKFKKLSAFFVVSTDALIRNNQHELWKLHMHHSKRRCSANLLQRAHKRHISVGNRGENLVYRREVARLQTAGSDYAALVDPHCAENPHLGYDILSYEPDGRPIYLEVKSTAKGPETPFFMTANELRVAQRIHATGGDYRICRVSHVMSGHPEITHIPFEKLLMEYNMGATAFKITQKGRK